MSRRKPGDLLRVGLRSNHPAALSPLVGVWRLILWGGSFLPDPVQRVDAGLVRFEWIEGGSVLAMHQGGDDDAPSAARMLIGRDQDADLYTVLYSDARGVLQHRNRGRSPVGIRWLP